MSPWNIKNQSGTETTKFGCLMIVNKMAGTKDSSSLKRTPSMDSSKSLYAAETGEAGDRVSLSHRVSILLDNFEPVPVSKHDSEQRVTSGVFDTKNRDGARYIEMMNEFKRKGSFLFHSKCLAHFFLWLIGILIIVISSIVLDSKSNFILRYDYDFSAYALYSEAETTAKTESIRWGFYFLFLIGLYIFVRESLNLIPLILGLWYKVVQKQQVIPHSISDRLIYYRGIRSHFMFFAMCFGAMVMGMKVFPTGMPENGVSKEESWWLRGWEFYWRKSLIALCVASLFLFVKKWIIRYISYIFHRVHYDDLAQKNNLCLEVVLKLRAFSKEMNGFEKHSPVDSNSNGLNFDSILDECFENVISLPEEASFSHQFHGFYEKYGTESPEALLDIKRESIALALNVRNAVSLAKSTKKSVFYSHPEDAASGDVLNESLKPIDFESVFPIGNDAENAFRLMDKDGNGDLTINEMVWFIANTFIQRQNLLSAMGRGDNIIKKLERIIEAAFSIFLIAILFTIYELPTSSLATLGTFFIGLSFVFGASASNLFQSILFIFVTHPYDVGDQVYISARNQPLSSTIIDVDLNKIIVFDIGLLSTTFLQPTGRLLYIANHILAIMDIENVRRSIQQSELVFLELPIFTPMDSVLALKQLVEQYIQKESRDFSSIPDLFTIRLIDPKKFQLVVRLQYSKRMQNNGLDLRWQKRTQFHEFLVDCCRKLSIETK